MVMDSGLTEFILRWSDGAPGSAGKSQEEGQEYQGRIKELQGRPTRSLKVDLKIN